MKLSFFIINTNDFYHCYHQELNPIPFHISNAVLLFYIFLHYLIINHKIECGNKNILNKAFFFHINYKLDVNTIRVYYITYNYFKDKNNHPMFQSLIGSHPYNFLNNKKLK